MTRPNPLVLIILDGWGYRAETKANAIALARKPTYDRLLSEYPNTLIHTSGKYVGLPDGQMGNSEVGHLNIGAGRIVHMDITRIDQMIQNGEFFTHPVLLAAMKHARTGGHRRWERIAKAFNAMVHGDAEAGKYADAIQGVKESYNKGVTDEFIVPFVCVDPKSTGEDARASTIRDEDSCICFNFRADRVRQITRALTRNSGLNEQQGRDLPGAEDLDATIPRDRTPKNLHYVCMTRYDKNFALPVVIPPESLQNILANVMAQLNLRNLRVAETEKYAHVTYFFNGGVEQPFPGEERILVPSPKVATYDLKPEMSAAGIADTVVKAVEDGTFDVIIVNFANADMVGHSGKIEPTVKAVETVDSCLGRIELAMRSKGGAMLITADHGNAEMMIDPQTGGPHTAHTTNPVPFIMVAENRKQFSLKPNCSLQDISPTVLGMLGVSQPKEMTGHDLRVENG